MDVKIESGMVNQRIPIYNSDAYGAGDPEWEFGTDLSTGYNETDDWGVVG
jgi:hypothetical protein